MCPKEVGIRRCCGLSLTCPISAPLVTSVKVKSIAALSATVPAAFSTCTLTPTPTPAAALPVVLLQQKQSTESYRKYRKYRKYKGG